MGHIHCKDKDGIPVPDALWQSRIEIAERDRQAKMEDTERARQARLAYKEFNDFREYQQRRNNGFTQEVEPYGIKVSTIPFACSTAANDFACGENISVVRPPLGVDKRKELKLRSLRELRSAIDEGKKGNTPKSNRMSKVYNIILFLLSPLMQPDNAEKNDDDADRVQK